MRKRVGDSKQVEAFAEAEFLGEKTALLSQVLY